MGTIRVERENRYPTKSWGLESEHHRKKKGEKPPREKKEARDNNLLHKAFFFKHKRVNKYNLCFQQKLIS